MAYTLALTSGAQSQNEGNPGGTAASWTYTLTRSGADINAGAQTYSFAIRNTDTSQSDDFATAVYGGGGSGGGFTTGTGVGTFVWAGNSTTATVTFTADPDTTIEANESPIIWFYQTATPAGVQILSTQDVSTNILTLANDDTGAPVFSTAAAFTGAENGTTIGAVTASAGGTAVTYTVDGASVDVGKVLIDATTGVLTFNANKNFEAPDDVGTNGVYNLKITATAGGISTSQDITVTLTNVNEAPAITGADTVASSQAENTTAVATLAYTDVDAGDAITWSISGGPDAAKFTIDSSGQLSFITAPNYESPGDSGGDNVYNVIVRATDAGGLYDEQQRDITITNANDPAVISSYGGAGLLVLSASENTDTTTTLATVVAADDDPGSTITYSKTGPDAAAFNIDATTGVLTFAASPDYEAPTDVGADNSYDVTIVATPTSGAAASQRFLVFVTNVVEAGESSGGGGGFTVTPPDHAHDADHSDRPDHAHDGRRHRGRRQPCGHLGHGYPRRRRRQ